MESRVAPYLRTIGNVCELVTVTNGEAQVFSLPRAAVLNMIQTGMEFIKATEIHFEDCRPCDTEAP